MENEKIDERSQPQRSDETMTGEHVARLFKHYRLLQNPYYRHPVPLKLVPVKTIYKKLKEQFDNFAKLAKKNSFDVDGFMKFCVEQHGIDEDHISICLTTPFMIDKYIAYLNKAKKLKRIYKSFMKTMKNIAAECIAGGYFTSIDLIRDLMKSNRLAAYVIAGKISIYYLAAIPNIGEVISKLDPLSRAELARLNDHFEIYHSDINKAFMQENHKLVNPIDLTDRYIAKLRKNAKRISRTIH